MEVENFKKIADLWGRLICLGKSIAKTDTFESMNILIATDYFHTIENEPEGGDEPEQQRWI